jgi:hypothetical protein
MVHSTSGEFLAPSLGAIAVVVTIVAVAANACASSNRCDMRTRTDSMSIKPTARTNWADMGASFHAAIANARPGAHH